MRACIAAAGATLMVCAMAWADGPPARPSADEVVRGLAGPEGWAVADLRVYSPDNVYEKIDGQDQAYLAFDLVAMANILFEKDKDGLDVEVYDMGKPEHALGIFAQQHRSPKTQYETIEGGEAAVFPAQILAWKGPFYVRIDRRRKAAKDDDGLVRRLACSVLRAIPGKADGAKLVAPLRPRPCRRSAKARSPPRTCPAWATRQSGRTGRTSARSASSGSASSSWGPWTRRAVPERPMRSVMRCGRWVRGDDDGVEWYR